MTNYKFPQMKYPEQKGLISIIVPIYNTKEIYLRECLDSILSQTFTNWEAILVNDGSMDNIGKIIDEYAKNNFRFITIHKQQNQSLLLARKTGLENSRGEFIANLDSDDVYNQQFLEKMYAKITETNADFVYCKYKEHNASCSITDYNWNSDVSKNIAQIMDRSQGMASYTWNKLIKRKIYVKVHFPNMYINHREDGIQILQVAYYSKFVKFVPENLYFYRDGGISKQITKTYILSEIQYAILINEMLEKFFKGIIPHNVKNAFYIQMRNVACCFFYLNKKERQIFKNKLKPLLPEFIKHQDKLDLKILCSLANKGIECPLKFREIIRTRIYLPIKKYITPKVYKEQL